MLASLVDRNHMHPFTRLNKHEHLMLSGFLITTVPRFYTSCSNIKINGDTHNA